MNAEDLPSTAGIGPDTGSTTAAGLTLYRNGSVYSAADPFASAMLVDGDTVAWVGSEQAATSIADARMRVVDLHGSLAAPGFVDSHAHLSATGFAAETVDLSAAASATELLDLVGQAAAASPGRILGHGWDETGWPGHRAPSAAELDNAADGREVYLSRVDMHSAVVSAALAARLALPGVDGWLGDGVVVRSALETAARAVYDVSRARGAELQRSALALAASRGYVALAELAAPHLGSADLLRAAVAMNAAGDLPEVLPYWGAAVEDVQEASEVLAGLGIPVLGLAGDINIDGSLGSRTALLRAPYTDAPHTRGTGVLTVEQVTAHLAVTSQLGIQGGFHIIGDAALDIAIEGLHKAAERVGIEAVRAARHRFEHVEMPDAGAIDALAEHSVTASIQPLFDEQWGGSGALYEIRLGAMRAHPMNPMGSLLAAGVPVCLGSDTPVTALDPWATVRACLNHHDPAQRISARAAFTAHTRAGWRAARAQNPLLGQLVPGAPASFAIWDVAELMVQTPDDRVQAWSTDPRAGTPLLPALDADSAPRCLQTVRNGRQLYAAADFPLP